MGERAAKERRARRTGGNAFVDMVIEFVSIRYKSKALLITANAVFCLAASTRPSVRIFVN